MTAASGPAVKPDTRPEPPAAGPHALGAYPPEPHTPGPQPPEPQPPEPPDPGEPDDLVVARPEGLYCPPGGFHIDPWRPVARAVLTHAHADHARRGHGAYLATAVSAGVLRARLGPIALQGLGWGETVVVNGVRVSLHPAGHVLGSAQVRLEHRGRVWVVSGDYFASAHAEDDADTAATFGAACPPLEPQRCDVFVTESTFGLPVYRWRPRRQVLQEIAAWWRANAEAGRCSLLLAYSFGKAQRLLAGLAGHAAQGPGGGIGALAVHPAVAPLNEAHRAAGVALPQAPPPQALGAAALRRALVVAPPAAQGSAFARALGEHADAFASGWMALRGRRRRQGLDRGFVLSDHADWPGLVRTIAATGAGRVIVTHGYEAVLVRWLRQQGLRAGSFRTEYGGEEPGDAGEAQPATAGAAAPPQP